MSLRANGVSAAIPLKQFNSGDRHVIRPRRTPRDDKHGFTLIELVMVIAITGILAVAVVNVVGNFKRSYVEVASKKVRSDIEFARSIAMMKRGTKYGIFFDDSNDRYTVYQTAVSSPVSDPQTRQPLIETFSRWSGVSITGGNYTVEFDSFGTPTLGGGGSVSITDGTTTKIISVTAVTGRVSVQ